MNPIKRRCFLQNAGQTLSVLALAGFAESAKAEEMKKGQPRIKIGQIGTAHAHASGKMETMRKFADRYEVVGIAEPDAEKRAEAQADPVYQSLKWISEEDLLSVTGLQAVAVETSVKDLVPTARRCIEAGVHVHLDKPAGESLPVFKELLSEATRKGLVVQMGYMLRYNPAFQFCFQAVREGWLGEVFEIHGVMSKSVGQSKRKELSEYPGGSMFELGCHLIDPLVYLMGAPDKVTPYTRRTRPEEDSLADNQLAVFEYPEATATVRSTLVEIDGGERRQFVVCGSQGTIDIRPLEPPRMRLALNSAREDFQKRYQDVDLPPMTGRYDGDFIDLAKIIRGEKQPDFTPEHDLAVQEAILRASDLPLG
jgi:predicted dehydrogenase